MACAQNSLKKRVNRCPKTVSADLAQVAPTMQIQPVMIRLITPFHPRIVRVFCGAATVLVIGSAPAFAQGRPFPIKVTFPPPKGKIVVPPGFAPPSGMCRVWIEGVPADQQPAPTDCATAVKNRPLNGRVIFSDEKATSPKPSKKKSKDEPFLQE